MGSCPGEARETVRRKLSTSVAVSAPDLAVPRVSVRQGSYVVPKVRTHPHGTELKLLGITSVSEVRVVPSPKADEGNSEPVSNDLPRQPQNSQ